MHLSTAIFATVHVSDCDPPPATPLPSLSSGCQPDRVYVVGVCEHEPARVCMWGREGLSNLPSPKTPTPTAPNAAASHLWLEVGMWASWQKL